MVFGTFLSSAATSPRSLILSSCSLTASSCSIPRRGWRVVVRASRSADPTSAPFSCLSAIAQTRERNCFRRSISFIVGQLSRPRATTGQSESHGGCKTRSEELVRSGRGRQPPPNHLPVRLHSEISMLVPSLSEALHVRYMHCYMRGAWNARLPRRSWSQLSIILLPRWLKRKG